MLLLGLAILLCNLKPIISEDCHFTLTGLSKLDSLHKYLHKLNITHQFDSHLLNSIPYLTSPLSEASLKFAITGINSSWLNYFELHEAISIEKKHKHSSIYSERENHSYLWDDVKFNTASRIRALKLKQELKLNDPYQPWQLLNDGSDKTCPLPGFDINVYPVYKAGYSGKGVMIIVVDDALDTKNVDLIPNLNMHFTDDLLNKKRFGPRGTDFKMLKENGHGTEVAGLAAAVANNSYCSFGVAHGATLGGFHGSDLLMQIVETMLESGATYLELTFEASRCDAQDRNLIRGIRLLGEKVTDLMVGEALIRFTKSTQIYISSWGPADDGMAFRMPRKYMNMALHHSSQKGNDGKGSMFFFPAGNGGNDEDNCGADGFVNHHSIVAVNAVGNYGTAPVYAESCSAVTISVPLGGSHHQRQFLRDWKNHKIILPTTAVNNKCTDQFIGTSAANPIAAGAVALALEANPHLTSRDVHALLSFSGRIPSPSNRGWFVNGAGMLVSHTFGAGLIDTARMVNLALNWTNIGPIKIDYVEQGKRLELRKIVNLPFSKLMSHYSKFKKIYRGKVVSIAFDVTSSKCAVEVLEVPLVHLQWVHNRRGSLKVTLTSPSGLTATLLSPRSKDRGKGAGEMIWKSLLHTGESAYGEWRVTITDTRPRRASAGCSGFIRYASLTLRGTAVEESAFSRNEEFISPTWSDIQRDVRKVKKGSKLTKEQVEQIFDYQRWNSLKEEVKQKTDFN